VCASGVYYNDLIARGRLHCRINNKSFEEKCLALILL